MTLLFFFTFSKNLRSFLPFNISMLSICCQLLNGFPQIPDGRSAVAVSGYDHGVFHTNALTKKCNLCATFYLLQPLTNSSCVLDCFGFIVSETRNLVPKTLSFAFREQKALRTGLFTIPSIMMTSNEVALLNAYKEANLRIFFMCSLLRAAKPQITGHTLRSV